MEKDSFYEVKRLSSNNEYYSNVFKKTERMVSVVFYILSYISRNEQTELHIKNISEKAMKVHECSLATLSLYEYEVKDKIFPFEQSLVALEGVLRISNSARVVNDEVLNLLMSEVDLIQRYLRNHFTGHTPMAIRDESVTTNLMSEDRPKAVKTPTANTFRPSRVNIPKGDISSDAHMVYSQLVDRSVRIKTVLEAKPESTIKDISEVITDVGEKTIQRELNSLIEKGQVIRQGERRWSKYSLAK